MAKSKIPKALSPGEEELAMHLSCYKVDAEREYQFNPDRSWRADFFISPDLLVEVEGGTRKVSRHTTHDGYSKDAEKYNSATLLGYRVLRFTSEHVHSGYAIDTICEAINGTKNLHGNASQSKEVSTAKQQEAVVGMA